MMRESGLFEALQSSDIGTINEQLYAKTGIIDFFHTQEEVGELQALDVDEVLPGEREFGDYQTPLPLALQICRYLRTYYGADPAIVIEPTFGKGNFLISSIQTFPGVKTVYGVEIRRDYQWVAKRNLSLQAISGETAKPDIRLFHDDIFTHSFDESILRSGEEVLIIGNPPWVTNSELGALEAGNLPAKQNLKRYKGLDAITGKSNFDICEYILLLLLETFQHCKGTLAMLCKNSVARKIVQELPRKTYRLSEMRLLQIDAKKEFQASADASLFVARFGGSAERIVCDTYELNRPEVKVASFGWHNQKFVSDIEKYEHASVIDGCSPFVWRSGIKHDCSSVMELTYTGDKLLNKGKQEVEIESLLVYDLLKSSDVKKQRVIFEAPRKKVIVTQKSIGEDTSWIARKAPRTWAYLQSHKASFAARKSSIYKGKPEFSIFGVGDYSFADYKVAISGMYKDSAFTLVTPVNGKPVMLDDTCYFLPFQDRGAAAFTFALLNGSIVQDFLQSVVFLDEKRPYTKDILMRIDLCKAAALTDYSEVREVLASCRLDVEEEYLNERRYEQYKQLLNSQTLL